jgi:hypothetical protein
MRKDTIIFSELQENFQQNDSHKAIRRVMYVMDSIRLKEKQLGLSKKPNCKFTVLQVFHLLLLFPFFCIKDAYHYGSSALAYLFSCEKDMFYRFMENDDVDWRNIIYHINNQLITRLSIRSDSKKSKLPVCLVADDTDMPKTGLRIELMGRIHSHVLGISRLGFKGLFLGRTDGKTQTILDVAVVGEKGKNPSKPHGMTKEQIAARFSKSRNADSKGQQRIKEYDTDKQTLLREMVQRAIKKGLRFDYLLVDSWFTCKELVHFIKRRHFGCHLLGMIKMGNTKYHTDAYGELTAKGCIDKLKRVKKGIRYSRGLKCYYGQMDVTFDGVKVRLFFCRRGKHGKWHGLLTTNTELDFFDAYRIYAMRWCIEVSFGEMKGFLGLGKCQARNFTAQIASISIIIIQYNMLCYLKRFDSYETIGGLFGEITTGTAEMTIADKVWLLIVEVVTEIAEMISADYIELMHAAINGNSHLHAMFVHEYAQLQMGKFTCES